jgi:hypothetical protein
MIHITALHCFHLAKLIRVYQEILNRIKLGLNIGDVLYKVFDLRVLHIDLLVGRQRTIISKHPSSRINTVYRFSLNSLDLIYSI